jgi:excinuclease ABC subunit A
VNRGNTVLIIEHNMDVIKVADYIIDLGPEGGDAGGTMLFQGIPEQLLSVKESHTATYLKRELNAR